MSTPSAKNARKKGHPRHRNSLPTRAKITNTTSEAQRARLLAALIHAQGRGVTTIEARTELNIMHPGGRVMELRDEGHRIEKFTVTLFDERGRKHSGVARYVLIALTGGGA